MSAAQTIPEELPTTGLLLADRHRLVRLRDRIFERSVRRLPVARELKQFTESLAAALARYEARRRSVPAIRYPEDLPVAQRIDELREALLRHPVVVVCGETGSGKTTQLPKACLEIGRGLTGLIGHTQPRRIAARSVAARLAEELGVELGAQVGFKVRFAEKASAASLVRVMTDGILLAEVHEDPDLLRYDTLLIDEAHERSLNIDFLLGYLKRLLPRRPDLKVVITSATIDPQKFASFFDAPVIEVSGRTYPIETRYRPLAADEEDDLDPGLIPGIVGAVLELERLPAAERGDVLVFVPGEREIREAAEAITQATGPRYEVLPLYSRLAWSDQQRVFSPSGKARVVLATNVAETSLTVPGIRAVVDSGLARISHYSARSKILRLPIEPISQASADQRRGRCGRIAPGTCIRLFSEEDYAARPRFTPPEILRTNLASVILQMEVLGLGDVDLFPFLDPPDTRQVSDGYRLLREIEAVGEERQVTELGRTLARIPLDPRLGRMLAESRRFGALTEALVLAAVLSMQDPRERPQGAQGEADQKHAQWADARSDFTALLNLWNAWQAVRGERSNSQARRWCRENFLSAARMREWEELVDQLTVTVREFDWRPNQAPATYEAVHRSLLPGLLGNVGEKSERADYLGARGLRFHVAPGTPVRTRLPRWLMAATITETQRVYARTVAAIEPEWIEAAAHHLVKRAYTDPEWSEQRGTVTAVESVSLYGLTIAAGRRVNYGTVEPEAARAIFVREALVHRRCRLRARFLERNARVRAALEDHEARLRRSGVLLDEDRIVAFYLARIPATVHSLQAFERWRRDAEARQPSLLEYSRADVAAEGAPEVDLAALPDRLALGGHELAVGYRFDPGADDDGATVRIPLPLLARLDAGEVEWGIPAWRHELLTELIRGLPKVVRRALVPAPDVAAECLADLGADPSRPFIETAAEWLSRRAGTPVIAAELRRIPVAAHLRLNLQVTDLDGRPLASGRDLGELKRALAGERAHALSQSADGFARTGIRSWDFGELPATVAVRREGLSLTLFPAIEDRQDSVALTLREDQEEAVRLTRDGVVRLLVLHLDGPLKHARKAMAADPELALLYQGVGALRPLVDQVCERAVERCCLPADVPAPRDRESFESAAEQGRAGLYDEAMRVVGVVKRALGERRAVLKELASLPDGVDAELVADTRAQLDGLLHEGVVGAAPDPWLDSLPRFTRAVARRAARLRSARGTSAQPHWDLHDWRRQVAALETERARRSQPPREAGVLLRWMVEELTVSLFAQELRTAIPVSPKRLRQQLELARAELDR